MKKLILLSALLLSTIIFSQTPAPERYTFASVGIDAANAIVGSEPTGNKPSLDFTIKAGAVDETKNLEIYIQYESFNKINYQSFGVAGNAILFPLYKVDLAIGGEFGMIRRMEGMSFFYYGVNGEVRYLLTDKFSIGAQANIKRRYDIEYLWEENTTYIFSGMINFRVRLN